MVLYSRDSWLPWDEGTSSSEQLCLCLAQVRHNGEQNRAWLTWASEAMPAGPHHLNSVRVTAGCGCALGLDLLLLGHGCGLGAGFTPSSRGGQSPLLVDTGTAGEATSCLWVLGAAKHELRAALRFHLHTRVPLSPEEPET